MAAQAGKGRRDRGTIRRRGNSYEVRVFSGMDPLTGKRVYLSESTRDAREAERIRTRLLAQVDKQRSVSTRATLKYSLNAWLDVHEAEPRTINDYRSYIRNNILPALGDQPISKLTPHTLERFYAELRKCRIRCNGRVPVDHATDEEHTCGEVRCSRKRSHDCAQAGCRVLACQPHKCKPMAAATVRKIHFVLSGALAAAERWGWIAGNPAAAARKPGATPSKPSPPSAADAARILELAWQQDPRWGMVVWLAMVTGARRGELVALRWSDLDLPSGVLEIRRAFSRTNGQLVEKDTKTHQMRRIGLDDITVELLRQHRRRYEETIEELRVDPSSSAFVFSYQPDHQRPCDPDWITHRYSAMCKSLDIQTHFHALRHYTATELIAAGEDIRSVAGQLGHGGGGTTTLKVYAAWTGEGNKRATEILSKKLSPPALLLPAVPPAPNQVTRLWFDTEFIAQGQSLDLLSIGVVRDDGETYYAERAEADRAQADPWVRDNVIPQLTGPVLSTEEIAAQLREFAGDRPEWWAYVAAHDWVALSTLYGSMLNLPEGWPMYCRDVQQRADDLGINLENDLPPPDQPHHALSDALWARSAWQHCECSRQ